MFTGPDRRQAQTAKKYFAPGILGTKRSLQSFENFIFTSQNPPNTRETESEVFLRAQRLPCDFSLSLTSVTDSEQRAAARSENVSAMSGRYRFMAKATLQTKCCTDIASHRTCRTMGECFVSSTQVWSYSTSNNHTLRTFGTGGPRPLSTFESALVANPCARTVVSHSSKLYPIPARSCFHSKDKTCRASKFGTLVYLEGGDATIFFSIGLPCEASFSLHSASGILIQIYSHYLDLSFDAQTISITELNTSPIRSGIFILCAHVVFVIYR